MKLYHGTTKERWEKIQTEGLKTFCTLCGFGDCRHCTAQPELLRFIYMTDDLVVAKRWGEVVLEIDTEKLDAAKLKTFREGLCDILKTTDFYNYCAPIPARLITKI